MMIPTSLETEKSNLIIYGHLCLDRDPNTGELKPGSPAWYIALLFQQLLVSNITVISPYGKDYPQEYLGNARLVPETPTSEKTLVYENTANADGERQQATANSDEVRSIEVSEIDTELLAGATVVIICPLLDTISTETIEALRAAAPGALFVLLPQGYYREIDLDGVVHSKEWETAEEVVRLFDFVILSEEDGENIDAHAQTWSQDSPVKVMVTKSSRGSTLYQNGQPHDVPAVHIDHVYDSTGAGDVFAAAQVFEYLRSQDTLRAAKFASAAAALHVSGEKLKLEAIESLLSQQS